MYKENLEKSFFLKRGGVEVVSIVVLVVIMSGLAIGIAALLSKNAKSNTEKSLIANNDNLGSIYGRLESELDSPGGNLPHPTLPPALEYGTAAAGDVLFGKSILTATGLITGTMPNKGAVHNTITTQDGQVNIQRGYHDGTGTVKASFENLTPENIRQGVDIGGVTGTLKEGGEVMDIVPNIIEISKILVGNENNNGIEMIFQLRRNQNLIAINKASPSRIIYGQDQTVNRWGKPLSPSGLSNCKIYDMTDFAYVKSGQWGNAESNIAVGQDRMSSYNRGMIWVQYTAHSTWNKVVELSKDDTPFYSVAVDDAYEIAVAVGAKGQIYTATDIYENACSNFKKRNSPVSTSLRKVKTRRVKINGVYTPLFIAVGTGGVVLTSTDGISWIKRDTPTTESLRDVEILSSGKCIAVGLNGTIILSDNYGETWTEIKTGLNFSKACFVYGGAILFPTSSSGNTAYAYKLNSDIK